MTNMSSLRLLIISNGEGRNTGLIIWKKEINDHKTITMNNEIMVLLNFIF